MSVVVVIASFLYNLWSQGQETKHKEIMPKSPQSCIMSQPAQAFVSNITCPLFLVFVRCYLTLIVQETQ